MTSAEAAPSPVSMPAAATSCVSASSLVGSPRDASSCPAPACWPLPGWSPPLSPGLPAPGPEPGTSTMRGTSTSSMEPCPPFAPCRACPGPAPGRPCLGPVARALSWQSAPSALCGRRRPGPGAERLPQVAQSLEQLTLLLLAHLTARHLVQTLGRLLEALGALAHVLLQLLGRFGELAIEVADFARRGLGSLPVAVQPFKLAGVFLSLGSRASDFWSPLCFLSRLSCSSASSLARCSILLSLNKILF